MNEEFFNQLLKHPFINKTEVAARMRPESERTQAQKTVSGRLQKNWTQPAEEMGRVKSELEVLALLIKKVLK